MTSPPLSFFFTLTLIVTFISTLAADDLQSDRAALLVLRAAFHLPWNASSPTCSWTGVSCTSLRVTSLRLPASNLLGPIPPFSIGNLTALRTLSLRLNALSGPLPPDLHLASRLRNLYLQGNRLTGDIGNLTALPGLVHLNLASNLFSGEIPWGFNNLTRLGTLFLDGNRFSGQLPDLDLPKLEQFNVSYNLLNGSIPVHLQNWPASAFLGMALCGGPLVACAGEILPTPAGKAGGGSDLSGGSIAGIAVGSAVAVLIILISIVIVCRRKKSNGSAQEAAVAKTAEAGLQPNPPPPAAAVAAPAVAGRGEVQKKLVFVGGGSGPFDLEDLLRASAEILGKGVFGTTYKTMMETGTTMAVKRLKDASLPEREFRERIEALGAFVHPNLVPLRGYYYSKDEKLLVYEFMDKGSLSAVLHGNRGADRIPLDWETRRGIALAAAKGIEYIHSRGPLASHGSIKSFNILLNESYDARVSDHGLFHLSSPTTAPARVAGYTAPEVTDTRKVSQKADVFSFGVVLLELLTGRSPQQALNREESVDLPRWVQSVVREEWTSEVFDPELLRYQNAEGQMVQLLQIGVDCTAKYPDKRPSMSEVVARIEEIPPSSVPDVEHLSPYTDMSGDQVS